MYQIIIRKRAKKFIDKLPQNEKKRIIIAIEKLTDSENVKKLKGYDDIFRLRVGDYRIIYQRFKRICGTYQKADTKNIPKAKPTIKINVKNCHFGLRSKYSDLLNSYK